MEIRLGVGSSLPVVVRTITQAQLNAYADASGDHNPLHLDADFAAETQFGGIIAHGMLTLGFISEMLASAYGRYWLSSGSLKVRFKGAAYVGDQVETWGAVIKQENSDDGRLLVCEVGARNCHSNQELISGTATVLVD
ncbi:MAG: MaoC family dehydratase [Dehalococcoidia bacterium]